MMRPSTRSVVGVRKRAEAGAILRGQPVRSLAPFHSITSSARASSVGGISRPSILAVWALMTNSNLVDCSTGRSAGLALEDAAGIDAGLAIHIGEACAVAHQSAHVDRFAILVDRGMAQWLASHPTALVS
jgi:hypothetical protein